jgi:hypothetical protein
VDHQREHWKVHKKQCGAQGQGQGQGTGQVQQVRLTHDASLVVRVQGGMGFYSLLSTMPPYAAASAAAAAASTFTAAGGLQEVFVIKVQTSLHASSFCEVDPAGPLMIYNAQKTLCFHLTQQDGQKAQHQQLVRQIVNHGVVTHVGVRCKGYFYAMKENNDCLRIFIADPCKTPDW